MTAIFISHSSKDSEIASEVYARLQEQGHRSVFLDFDPADGIPAGRNWEQELYQRIRTCRAVIVLCSEHSMGSRWCFMEITHGRALGKELFSIKVGDCEIDSLLSDRQIIDLTKDKEGGFQKLWDGLRTAGIDASDPFDWDGSRPPFPGLLAFQEEDAAIFFGRDEEIGEGLDRLNKVHRLGAANVIMVLGASGSGKSSLVRAGLLPRVRRDVERWLVVDPFRPHDDPFRELANVLARALAPAAQIETQTEIYERLLAASEQRSPKPESADPPAAASRVSWSEPYLQRIEAFLEELDPMLRGRKEPALQRHLRGLREALRESAAGTQATDASRRSAPDSAAGDALHEIALQIRMSSGRSEARVLLVIDQFEELLGHAEDHPASRLLGLLRRSVDMPGTALVVVGTMRSDFLGTFQKTPALIGLRFQKLALGPMAPEAVAQIIEKPAELAKIDLEPGLVQSLMEDAGKDDALPLLAFTLRVLWDRYAGDGLLEVEEYRERLGGLYGAVANVAKEVTSARPLSSEEQDDLRTAFVSMVRINEAGQYARRPTYWGDLAARSHELLERFVLARLLVSRGDDKGRVVEVAHEALFRAWDQLKGWLDEDRVSIYLRDGIRRAALEWEAGGRQSQLLIHRGARCEAAESLARQPRFELDALAHDYVQACVDLKYQEEEAERLHERARQRRLVGTVIGLAVGLLIVTGLAFFALDAKNRAIEAGNLALVRQLAARAEADFHLRPQWSLLLAVEAIQLARENDFPLRPLEETLRKVLSATGGVALGGGHFRAAFAGNGRWLVTSGDTGTLHVWELGEDLERPATPRVIDDFGDESPVRGMAASSTGRWLAAGTEDGHLLAWDLAALAAPPRTLVQPGSLPLSAIGMKDDWLVAGTEDGTVQAWNLSEDSPMRREVGRHQKAVVAVIPASQSNWLATGDDGGEVRLWDLQVPSLAPRALGMPAAVSDSGVVAAVTGQHAITGTTDGWVLLWRLDAPLAPPQRLGRHDGEVVSVTASSDGRYLASGGRDAGVRVWDLTALDQDPIVLRGHEDWIAGLSFSFTGPRLATASWDGTARIWDLSAPETAPVVLRGHEDPVLQTVFDPQGRWLASAGEDDSGRLWSLRSPAAEPIELGRHRSKVVTSAIAAAEPGRLATGGRDRAILLWQLDAPEQPPRELAGHEDVVTSLAFAPGGTRLASGDAEGQLLLWGLDAPEATPTPLHRHADTITAVAFSADNQWLASGDLAGNVLLLRPDAPEQTPIAMPLDPAGTGVIALSFPGAGRELRVATQDQAAITVMSWDPDQPQSIPTTLGTFELGEDDLYLDDDGVFSVAFDPSAQRIATGGHSVAALHRVQIANAPGVPLTDPDPELKDWVESITFDATGDWVAAGGRDKLVRLWRTDAAQSIPRKIKGHREFVTTVAFSSGARWLATSDQSGKVRLWRLDVDEMMEIACRTAGRNLTPLEWRAVFDSKPRQPTCPDIAGGQVTSVKPVPPQ